MFSNEYSLPYLTEVKRETVAAMGRIIGELQPYITVPYGVNVLWEDVYKRQMPRKGHIYSTAREGPR